MAHQPLIGVMAAGVVSSLGLTASATFAALRGGVDAYRETFFRDSARIPVVGALISREVLGFPIETTGMIQGGDEKLIRMLNLAVADCTAGQELGTTALLLIGPEMERCVFSNGIEKCLGACADEIGFKLDESSRAFCLGSPGLADALRMAHELLVTRKVKSVLLAGVDSLLGNTDIFEGLIGNRILATGVSTGYVPGEAAACVLLGRVSERDASAPVHLLIRGVGSATESRTLEGKKRSAGIGLATAIKHALADAQVEVHNVSRRYADVSGEPYFFEEASLAWSRLLRAPLPLEYEVVTPVTRLGYVGAAIGPLMLALLHDEIRWGYRSVPIGLIHLSHQGSLRAAVVTASSDRR